MNAPNTQKSAGFVVRNERIPACQYVAASRVSSKRLRLWRIRFEQVGEGVGRVGMTDENVIALLHKRRSVTFFIRDVDYYKRKLCHARNCLVYLDTPQKRTAETIRRFLRHPQFRTRAQRLGKVIRVNPSGMHAWQLGANKVQFTPWSS